MVAFVNAGAVAVGGSDREADLDLTAAELTCDVEAGVSEDAEHGSVLRQDLGDETLDADCAGARRQLLQEARANAASLQLVGDGEGDLGDGRVTQTGKLGEGDDARGGSVADDGDERVSVLRLREQVLDQRPVDARTAVEARVQALRGQLAEEGEECVAVWRLWLAQSQRRAVAEDDVDGTVGTSSHGRHWFLSKSAFPVGESEGLTRSCPAM